MASTGLYLVLSNEIVVNTVYESLAPSRLALSCVFWDSASDLSTLSLPSSASALVLYGSLLFTCEWVYVSLALCSRVSGLLLEERKLLQNEVATEFKLK